MAEAASGLWCHNVKRCRRQRRSFAVSSIFAQYGAAIRSFNRSLRHPRHQAFALAVVVVLITGVVFYRFAEDWSFANSLYFTVIALSTIGFGDIAPTTTFSRLFTVLYAIIGVGLIGTLLNLVVTNAQQAIKHREPGSGTPEN
jgi:voltage-gated potassium channel